MCAAAALIATSLAGFVLLGCGASPEPAAAGAVSESGAANPKDREAAELNAQLGESYLETGNYEAAKEYLQAALALGKRDGATQGEFLFAQFAIQDARMAREQRRIDGRHTVPIGECMMRGGPGETWTGLEGNDVIFWRTLKILIPGSWRDQAGVFCALKSVARIIERMGRLDW